MSEQTKIEWCDSTLNFWSGCTKVSPGCANCYAETLSNRKLKDKNGNLTIGQWGKGAPRKLHESAFTAALKLNRKPWVCNNCGSVALATTSCDEPKQCAAPHTKFDRKGHPIEPIVSLKDKCGNKTFHRRRIFSLSLADWLDPEVPVEWLARMLDTIRQCDQVTWILCTKRPELWDIRMRAVLASGFFHDNIAVWVSEWLKGNPPQHIILLASVENQPMADKRIPELLRIPAACRGLSLEPLLGEVTISPGSDAWEKLNWLIIGGESGPGARACNVEWIRSLVAQGKAAGVATFVKQLGANSVSEVATVPDRSEWRKTKTVAADTGLLDKKGGDWSEWPEDLRVREWPKGF